MIDETWDEDVVFEEEWDYLTHKRELPAIYRRMFPPVVPLSANLSGSFALFASAQLQMPLIKMFKPSVYAGEDEEALEEEVIQQLLDDRLVPYPYTSNQSLSATMSMSMGLTPGIVTTVSGLIAVLNGQWSESGVVGNGALASTLSGSFGLSAALGVSLAATLRGTFALQGRFPSGDSNTVVWQPVWGSMWRNQWG